MEGETEEKEDKEIMEHTIDPVYDEYSRILILGSFPSVKSREQKFFYGHKQNRFWKVLAGILGCEVPQTIEEKKVSLTEGREAGRYCVCQWPVLLHYLCAGREKM